MTYYLDAMLLGYEAAARPHLENTLKIDLSPLPSLESVLPSDLLECFDALPSGTNFYIKNLDAAFAYLGENSIFLTKFLVLFSMACKYSCDMAVRHSERKYFTLDCDSPGLSRTVYVKKQ